MKKNPRDIAHEMTQRHMDQAGVIGHWELLENRIEAALRTAYLDGFTDCAQGFRPRQFPDDPPKAGVL